VKLLGARPLVTGIRPDVAAALTASDADLKGVLIVQTLERAVDLCAPRHESRAGA
jgi:hypothetical protein